MIRGIIAVVIGLLIWGIVATALDILLRVALPGYAAAEPQLHFTLAMMIARLALPGALPSIAAGFVGGLLGRGNRLVIAAVGIVLLCAFLPTHYRLRNQFPVWYHVTFLGSLILLTWLGGLVGSRVSTRRQRLAALDVARPATSQLRT